MVNQKNKFIIIGEDSKSLTSDKDKADEVIELINDGKHVFMFIFMEGCGHCDNAKPAWHNLKNLDIDDVALVLLNQKLLDDTSFSGLKKLIGEQPLGFPTFKHIHKNKVDEYSGDRDEESLKKWIQQKCKTSLSKNTKKYNFTLKGGYKKSGKRKTKLTKIKEQENGQQNTRKASIVRDPRDSLRNNIANMDANNKLCKKVERKKGLPYIMVLQLIQLLHT